MKDFISIHDLSAGEVEEILNLAADLKTKQKRGEKHEYLWAKSMAMIFEKPSTRTRVSFEIGMWQLGGLAINLDQEAIGLGSRESIGDVARTLSRFADAILIRTFSHQKVIELAQNASVPVINALSDLLHPCQALSDVFTIREKKGKNLRSLKMAYIGDGNNVCHSLMFAAAKVGINLTVATPKGYEPKGEIVLRALEDARHAGIEIAILNDPVVAARGADVIYTDVWASMGQEKEKTRRAKTFLPYQVNAELAQLANPNYIFMHCLPAHRGDEVTDTIIDSPNSVVFDQAENRLHVQKAILVKLLKG
ncbi:ornithine carbamoyltransferase [candidate division WOR-1 bacterium RIFOXYA12_FULL_52_29]|uniref:Ornithine carbamoyltransferase n=1 Tax=candidate division WOR-1 bacterium RIFOXYC12_FULL_54_18 TaxID=1802584 RepID=A0A1F4T7D8_UNCSA|nr:MAG: ornithine carbamoyltransferase [candidate division WOR-1 bacterium RIFOXYA2_FULL_51_19]OGC18207.1 MAG: ornithine carbamoyltransferase [candidate division WOR-1 bacterium RIFOXYA12_FULL_52_29]OGC27062.1 MAG: ornithine carbamoyltransferase [candidate division WOR-1 bacterium RIFOXYB2_FULL_45_9]OGC28624.1 MAG: ornithine carbamoyltransferase [candidate division WOR-1 bacterium RIFOXYC12_FULL_54_18]OGC30921.1 MAG: ornithine carbamoyltransferase [candidate division WOR-1 bacterium RIFOXYB12_F